MNNRLSEKCIAERLARNLSVRDVAVGIGYRNINKGIRRVAAVEEGCGVDSDLLDKIIKFFNWDRAEVEQLVERDRQEYEQDYKQKRNAWLDEPIEPHCIVKPFCGCYLRRSVPEDCTDQAGAETYAAELSRTFHSDVWYVISRRHSIHYKDGVRQGEECEYDVLPRMYLKNHTGRPFLLHVTEEKQTLTNG
jgi:hypothetical protein